MISAQSNEKLINERETNIDLVALSHKAVLNAHQNEKPIYQNNAQDQSSHLRERLQQ